MKRNKFLKLFGVGVIAAPVVAKAALEVRKVEAKKSKMQMAFPNVTRAQMLAIENPKPGLIVCEVGNPKVEYYFFEGNTWCKFEKA